MSLHWIQESFAFGPAALQGLGWIAIVSLSLGLFNGLFAVLAAFFLSVLLRDNYFGIYLLARLGCCAALRTHAGKVVGLSSTTSNFFPASALVSELRSPMSWSS